MKFLQSRTEIHLYGVETVIDILVLGVIRGYCDVLGLHDPVAEFGILQQNVVAVFNQRVKIVAPERD